MNGPTDDKNRPTDAEIAEIAQAALDSLVADGEFERLDNGEEEILVALGAIPRAARRSHR